MEYSIKVFMINPFWTEAKSLLESLGRIEDIEIVGEAGKYESALIKIGESRPDVVLIDDRLKEDCYRLAEEITRRMVNTAVIVLGENLDENYYRKMLQAGVRDFVKKPVDAAVLVESIYAAYEREKDRQVISSANPAEETKNSKTKVITVFSNKGGIGKTTISVNLAVSIAKNYIGRTVLWDLDLHNGLVATAANVIPRRHLTDMLNELHYLDEELLKSYLEPHESGLKVLPAPFTPEFADFVSAEHVNKIISVAKEGWDYVIVDTPSFFSEQAIEVMKHSDLILLIGSLDLGAVKNLKAALMVLGKLNFSRAKIRLILNRVGSEFGITPKDVENTLNMPVFATIPADAKSVITALNQGVPAVHSFPSCDFSKSINLLAKSVIGSKAVEKTVKKEGLLKKLSVRSSRAGG